MKDVEDVLERSRLHWRDRKPSTFLIFSSTVAFLSFGEVARAKKLVQETPVDDWFALAAKALCSLQTFDASQALEYLARAHTSLPRLQAIGAVLAADAHLHLHRPGAAALVLKQFLHLGGDQSLLRFAYLFLSQARFDAHAAAFDDSETLRALLQDAARDIRVIKTNPLRSLTKSEEQILDLLISGASNSDIAQTRFVTLNTVRTQLKQLYRKLGVRSRNEAVQLALQWDRNR